MLTNVPFQWAQNMISWTVGSIFDVMTSGYTQLRISVWHFLLIMLFFYRLSAPPVVIVHLGNDRNTLSEGRSYMFIQLPKCYCELHGNYR